jgi:hypothetical protein
VQLAPRTATRERPAYGPRGPGYGCAVRRAVIDLTEAEYARLDERAASVGVMGISVAELLSRIAAAVLDHEEEEQALLDEEKEQSRQLDEAERFAAAGIPPAP